MSEPIESGFFYFKTPNSFQPGVLYQLYRQSAPDFNNNMVLIDYHIDSLIGYSHYKYQQTFMDIPIEGAGCIEHYSSDGSLDFINAKVADSIKESHIPKFRPEEIIEILLNKLNDGRRVFAWQDEEWEKQIKLDNNDTEATWYPTPELIWAIDELRDVEMIIPGDRYKLAYKIPVTYIYPTNETMIYYLDANNGVILKERSTVCNDGPAKIYGYGTKIIDTQWKGGFTQKFILKTNDNGRNIHTKKPNNINSPWWTISNVKDDDDNWGDYDMKETSTHYHVSNSWDYFKFYFGRNGQNNAGINIRIRTQLPFENADFGYYSGYNQLRFGFTDYGGYLGEEPSIVGHEYTHGVIHHTSNLAYEFESGALNESFADIFGTVIQAKMLDGGSTDWILGNHVPISEKMSRSLKYPKTRGEHFGGNIGQPDTYGGDYWYSGGDYDYDYGGIHVNSGVQNKWFYLLTDGDYDYNDNDDYYNILGIGMDKAVKIAYLASTSFMLNSSQYSDSRQATIKAAKLLYDDCSQEHRSTANAWYAVGVGDYYNCSSALINNYEEVSFNVYPNPADKQITIEMPDKVASSIVIYDVSGQVVDKIESNNSIIYHNVCKLSSGIYIIKFDFKNSSSNKKLIIR